MSINSLLVGNSDKSWSNLYVNCLTSYNDVTVKGQLKLEGPVTPPGNVLKVTCSITGAVSGHNIDIGLYEFGGIVTLFIKSFDHTSTQDDILILTPSSWLHNQYKPKRDFSFLQQLKNVVALLLE